MNIFVLACSARATADLHCDQHLCKMVVETCQMLYTYLDSMGLLEGLDLKDRLGMKLTPYKPTHKHHPCTLWLHGGRSHVQWLLALGQHLCERYHRIFGQPKPIKKRKPAQPRGSKKLGAVLAIINKHNRQVDVEYSAPKFHATQAHFDALSRQLDFDALPDDCWPAEWLRRLKAHGVSRDAIAACIPKVCLADPPDGCHFGVACMGDDTVPLELDERGDASTVYSYRNLMRHKQAVSMNMRFAQQDDVPLALQEYLD